jgi:two-component system LytT family response regulator
LAFGVIGCASLVIGCASLAFGVIGHSIFDIGYWIFIFPYDFPENLSIFELLNQRKMTSTLKAIVVDDEQPAREVLMQCIRDFCPEVEVVAECSSAKEAYQAIREHHPELVFLDVEMPKGSGFDLLEMFHPVFFHVIFVTAFSDYAVQAFRYAAVDYLLKPLKVNELVEAVSRARNGVSTAAQHISLLLENYRASDHNNRKLAISSTKGFDLVRISDIILCEADGPCTRFHLSGKKKIVSSHLLKYYEELLPHEQFMRVHHSYIINKEMVKSYTHQGEIILTDETRCPLSTKKKGEFLKMFKMLK